MNRFGTVIRLVSESISLKGHTGQSHVLIFGDFQDCQTRGWDNEGHKSACKVLKAMKEICPVSSS